MLSILTLNIQAASSRRARMLLEWLTGRDDDLLILTETSAGAGTTWLLDQFSSAGYLVIHTPGPAGDRGAALVSRIALTPRPELTSGVSLAHRMVTATLDTEPAVTILGVYVPSSDRAPDKLARKRAFVAALLDMIETMPGRDRAALVLAGDYNVIGRDHQPRYPGFFAFEYGLLDALNSHGLVDAHDHWQPGVQAHSWFGRAGNGYRFDYAHLGPILADLLDSCAYLQHPREHKLTDHAALAARLRVAVGDRIAVDRSAFATAATLF